MLEKTYTTFHASNMLLRQQYRERRFTKYSELIACLLVAEQNNELLLKNHQSCPIGSISLPEVNATIQTNRHGCGRGRGYFYGQCRGRSRDRYISWNQCDYNQPHNKKNNSDNQKLNHSEILPGQAIGPYRKRVYETECYRCGMKCHWSHTCRTTKHLVDLYQASIKGKGNQIETNFINGQGTMDPDDPYQVSLQEANNQIDDNFNDNDGAIEGSRPGLTS